MDYFIRCAYPLVAYTLVPVTLLAAWFVWQRQKKSVYHYSLVTQLRDAGAVKQHPYRRILWTKRLLMLLALALLIAKPQLVDVHSKVQLEGIDIMLALDVSGSMERTVSQRDERRRIDIAKEEAIKFINKRHNDALGLVLFGKVAVARCPLTPDKQMLARMVHDVELGFINPEGTVIATALVSAANRLKNSTAKSKVIILLTDGEASPDDSNPAQALKVLKEMGIKVYTIGIGQYTLEHSFFGMPTAQPLDTTLIETIAKETGGKFFKADDPRDLGQIYNTIDALEKTQHETDIYQNYYDIFVPIVWFLLKLLFIELILTSRWWLSIW